MVPRFEPTGNAKYVEFTTIVRPEEMNGQRSRLFSVLSWPYREGLRLDEAMHPLALLAIGLYGQELPNQNGAPLRLVVPWKYGFKSIKSIVKIQFVEKEPVTTWMKQEPQFYGFYSNVNPAPTRSEYRDQSNAGRVRDAEDPDVQRLRRAGGADVLRDGSAQVLLTRTFTLSVTPDVVANCPIDRRTRRRDPVNIFRRVN